MKIKTRVIEDPAGDPEAPIGSPAWRKWFAAETKAMRRDVQTQASELAARLVSMRDSNYHETFGLPSFDSFCEKVLDLSPEQVRDIIEADPGVRVCVVLGSHGGDRRSEAVKAEAEGKADQGSDTTLKIGRGRQYLTARLDRDRPDIAAQVHAGELSARKGAILAGIIRELSQLEKAQAAFRRLSKEDRDAFDLWRAEQPL